MASNIELVGDLDDIPVVKKKSPPLVQGVEATKGWWFQSAALGKSLELIPRVMPVAPNQYLWVNGYPTGPSSVGVVRSGNLPGPPRARSIVLARSDVMRPTPGTPGPSPNPTPNLRIRALIEFGLGGVLERFVCDWGAGTTVNLVASIINVTALFEPFDPSLVYSNTWESLVGSDVYSGVLLGGALTAALGTDLIPAQGPNTYSEFSALPASPGYVDIPVPKYAVGFQPRYYSGASWTADVQDATFNAYPAGNPLNWLANCGRYTGADLDASASNGYPLSIPKSAQSIRVTSSALLGGQMRYEWVLSL